MKWVAVLFLGLLCAGCSAETRARDTAECQMHAEEVGKPYTEMASRLTGLCMRSRGYERVHQPAECLPLDAYGIPECYLSADSRWKEWPFGR